MVVRANERLIRAVEDVLVERNVLVERKTRWCSRIEFVL